MARQRLIVHCHCGKENARLVLTHGMQSGRDYIDIYCDCYSTRMRELGWTNKEGIFVLDRWSFDAFNWKKQSLLAVRTFVQICNGEICHVIT